MVDHRYFLVGIEMFAARAAHNALQQDRKDDLESLRYILLYFINSLFNCVRRININKNFYRLCEGRTLIFSRPIGREI